MERLKPYYDVVVLGAGPAGLAAAIAITTNTDASVLVVDRQSPGQLRVGENCPPETLLLLKQLGVLEAFYQGGHEPCPGFASIWGRATPGYNDFIVNPLGPSWRLNRPAFDAMLAAQAERCGAQLCWSTSFIGCQVGDNQPLNHQPNRASSYTLNLKQQKTHTNQGIQAGFVIDATGSKSRFAKALNIHKTLNDQLYATVRFAEVSHSQHQKLSKQVQLEATPFGWCYQARLPHNKLVSMVVSEHALLAAIKTDQYQGFEQALNSTLLIGPCIAQLPLQQLSFHHYALEPGLLNTLEGTNWMAIGDAALSFDPISAQGIYKGLNHGLLAAKKVQDWLAKAYAETTDYSAKVKQQYQIYRRTRDQVYAKEQRWGNSDFWQQRHAAKGSALAI